MPEHLVNAPVSMTAVTARQRAGYHDAFEVVRLKQHPANLRVVRNWAARFADANLGEEEDEILLTKRQLASRRILNHPGDEASRRNMLPRGTTL